MIIAAWIVGPIMAYLAGVGLAKEISGEDWDSGIPWVWPLVLPIWVGTLVVKGPRRLLRKEPEKLPKARAL